MAETAHLADPAATAAGLFANPRGIAFFPVRHHSPACAFQLCAALRELRPAAVLIEGPVDFATLIPEVLAPGVVPPVAMVALPSATERAAGARVGVTYYPLCSHSPEFLALQER